MAAAFLPRAIRSLDKALHRRSKGASSGRTRSRPDGVVLDELGWSASCASRIPKHPGQLFESQKPSSEQSCSASPENIRGSHPSLERLRSFSVRERLHHRSLKGRCLAEHDDWLI